MKRRKPFRPLNATPDSAPLRQEVVALVLAGKKTSAISGLLGISADAVRQHKHRARHFGELPPVTRMKWRRERGRADMTKETAA